MVGLLRDAHALRLAQEETGFFERFAEVVKTLVEADKVEQIAMLAGRRILPAACVVAGELHEQAFPARALRIAGDPVTAGAPSERQISPADGFRPAPRGGATSRLRNS